MKTQKFTAYIKKLQYGKVEIKNPTKYQDPVLYYCKVKLMEIKIGMNHSPKREFINNAMLYITEDEYNTQAIGVGDKVEISDKAQWIPSTHNIKIYDKQKLEKMDSSQLKKDINCKTYAEVVFDAYTLQCKKGQWKIVEKADEICYIQCGKAKFYFDPTEKRENQNCINSDVYLFFFEKDTYDKIIENNDKEIEVSCYVHKQRKWKKTIKLVTAFDADSGKYFANLFVKGEMK